MPRIYYKAEGTKYVIGVVELAPGSAVVLSPANAAETVTSWSYGRDGTISPTFDTTLVLDSNPQNGTVAAEQYFFLTRRAALATASQKWQYDSTASAFRNVYSSNILIDLKNRNVKVGNPIWSYKQNGTPAQQWNPDPPPLPLTGKLE